MTYTHGCIGIFKIACVRVFSKIVYFKKRLSNVRIPLFKEKGACRVGVGQENRIQSNGFRTVTQTLNKDIKNRFSFWRPRTLNVIFYETIASNSTLYSPCYACSSYSLKVRWEIN